MPTPRCRLFVFMAREKPRALVLRRGPSAWAHLILWNTSDDSFEHGAWLKGRIYENCCDLSPEGDLFLAFVLQGSRWGTSYEGTWTAVSRVPWLHALTLWPKGNTWGGGGRFLDRRKVGLHESELPAAHPDHPVSGLEVTLLESLPPRESDAGPGDWNGHDQQGHTVLTRGGKLFRVVDGDEVELADFTALEPEPKPAPGWATEPLRGKRGHHRKK